MQTIRSRLQEQDLPEPVRTHLHGLYRRALTNAGTAYPVPDPDGWLAGLDYLAHRVEDPDYDLLPVLDRHAIEPWRVLGSLPELRELSEFRAYVGEWIRAGESLASVPGEVGGGPERDDRDEAAGIPIDDPFAVADLDPVSSPSLAPIRLTAGAVATPRCWAGSHAPYPWQLEAAFAWEASGRRGILEVVTGAGKTAAALLMLGRLVDEAEQSGTELQTIVVVPRVALVEQWRRAITATLNLAERRVGEIHGGSKCLPEAQDVLIITQDSARTVLPGLRLSRPTLLIADECHRLGAPASSSILDRPWNFTLGLSATPERSADLAFEEVLVPRLGSVVYRYGYSEAVRDGILAPFDLVRVQVEFTPEEQLLYDRQTDDVRSLLDALKADYPSLRRTHGLRFFQVLGNLKRGTTDERFDVFTALAAQRRMTVHLAARKLGVARLLATQLSEERRVLCFHERIEAADAIESILKSAACSVTTYHTGMSSADRHSSLEGFRAGRYRWLVACRALDEGLDIPAVDTVVIFAGSKTARQLIQRLGRALRRKPDGRGAWVLLVEVAGVDHDLLEQVGLADLRAAASSETVVPAAILPETLRRGPATPHPGTERDRLGRGRGVPSAPADLGPKRTKGNWLAATWKQVRGKLGLLQKSASDGAAISSPRRAASSGRGTWTGTPGTTSYYDKDSSPE